MHKKGSNHGSYGKKDIDKVVIMALEKKNENGDIYYKKHYDDITEDEKTNDELDSKNRGAIDRADVAAMEDIIKKKGLNVTRV